METQKKRFQNKRGKQSYIPYIYLLTMFNLYLNMHPFAIKGLKRNK